MRRLIMLALRISFNILVLLFCSSTTIVESSPFVERFLNFIVPLRHPLIIQKDGSVCRPEVVLPPVTPVIVAKEFLRCAKEQKATGGRRHPLLRKRTEEVIQWYGYPVEMYNVTTEDGYILLLHRIPSLRVNATSVLLMHGLAGSSDIWTLNGKEQSLAFILSDLGYDVWLGNCRGSTYSLGHKTLPHDDDEDLRYWDFSWHESGIYDLPAIVKLIRTMNGGRGMFYVGHSQGNAILAIAASSAPSPAASIVNKESIIAAFHLSPAMYLGRAVNLLKLLKPKLGTGREVISMNHETWVQFRRLRGRIDTQTLGAQGFLNELNPFLGEKCSGNTATLCSACTGLIYWFYGFDGPLLNYTNVPNILDKFPNITPFKSMIHFAQSMKYCTFREFDYGEEENQRRYGGSPIPPVYDLGKVEIPSYFFYGEVDNWVGEKDARLTASLFPPGYIKEIIRVDNPYFNHGDFLIAKNVKELVYDKIIERMKNDFSA